jgi:sugar-specific transcriptional regulator TrmB
MLEPLKDLGLSDIEIKIYEKLFTKGEQTILELSKNAGINRSYCYEVLEKLSKKGFITKLLINNKSYWKALPSEQVLGYIDELKEKVSSSLQNLNQHSKLQQTKIEIHQGKKGIKNICDKISESNTKVIGFGAEGQIKKFLPLDYKHIFNKLKNNKIKFELLTLKNKIPVIKDNTKFKSFKKEFDTCVEINVFDDKTIIFFWKDNLEAIEITDMDIANSFRNYHKQLWNKN